MNTFMNELKKASNITLTDNGAIANKSTLNSVYDMFAFGGAYRNKSEDDVILLFKEAYEEDATLALRCLFYLGDIRGGQGERRFFRTCFKWLAVNHPKTASFLICDIPEYRRWDDVIIATYKTPVWPVTVALIKHTLEQDMKSKTPSLCAKWMPSENASSTKTKTIANTLRNDLKYSHKEYRKMLSALRKKINIVERLMSENRWDEIEFDKIPSKAGIIYRNAFARRDIIAKRYENFAMDKNTKVNANTLYPYDVVKQARTLIDSQTKRVCNGYSYGWGWHFDLSPLDAVQRAMIGKYWENLPDYLNGSDCSMMCVVDTSGSMEDGYGSVAPIDVAISLGLYCAERVTGPFANNYISFSSQPQLIATKGTDFVDKVARIYETNLCQNTDLEAVFNMILNMATSGRVKASDIPKTLVVISDMQIDSMITGRWAHSSGYNRNLNIESDMDAMAERFRAAGIEMPNMVYWNVNATNPVILQKPGARVSYVSGCSPVIFEQVIKGVTGVELMLDKLNSERYAKITVAE